MLINNATYQRETLSERPIRQTLRVVEWVTHSVKASLWCVTLLINTIFRFFFFFFLFKKKQLLNASDITFRQRASK